MRKKININYQNDVNATITMPSMITSLWIWCNTPVMALLLVDDDDGILSDPLRDWITTAVTKVKVLLTKTRYLFCYKKGNV